MRNIFDAQSWGGKKIDDGKSIMHRVNKVSI